MAVNEHYFVEWKEQYVSKERGNRVVHYFLKDNLGESICAVVGTERSVRHMFYVVSEEFLNAHGVNNSVHAGFRWRSRREVVNWLTSMLSKQRIRGEISMSPKDDTVNVKPQQAHTPSPKGRLSRNLKARRLDISWAGSAWACCKQLKHFPAFKRNGISIAVNSFVFVMAEKDNRYVAYLEDMYEDRKCQKKVKVRWFHHYKEVRGAVALRDPDPKELFITPYAQVISVECVDGPAVVLTREHYAKCFELFPNNLLGGVYYCCRQFKSNRLKPFRLGKLRGYLDQPIFSCFSPDFFEEEKLCSEDNVKVGTKRKRSSEGDHQMRKSISSGELHFHKINDVNRAISSFTPNQKVEFLCQDSGIRGCWFKCTVLEVSKRQMKILYDDLTDEDNGTNPQEWVPMYRVAKADKLGMRHNVRSTVRPAYSYNQESTEFDIGDAADAWWSDGWWEGVIISSGCSNNGFYEFYIPGENLYLKVEPKNLRVSREWIGDRWVDVDPKPDILSIISTISSTDPKLSAASSSAFSDGTSISNTSPALCPKASTNRKLSAIEEEIPDLEGMTLVNVPLKDECTNEEQQNLLAAAAAADDDDKGFTEEDEDNTDVNNCEGNNITDDDLHQENKLVECKVAGPDLDAEAAVMLASEC